jgi:DNA-directed RNA polymerase subunit RPC12/RpoP
MPKVMIRKDAWKCLRCGHIWESKENDPKHEKPITCPSCRSPYWDIPKKEEEDDKPKNK